LVGVTPYFSQRSVNHEFLAVASSLLVGILVSCRRKEGEPQDFLNDLDVCIQVRSPISIKHGDLLADAGEFSKDLVDAAPKSIKSGASKEEAESIKAKLEGVGAAVEIK